MADLLLYECPLITGASGGLGQEFAMQLAPHCRRMVLVARREKSLRQVEEQLRDENPGLEVTVFPVDLTRAAARRDLIGQLSGSKWAPDLLVNNAGMGDYGEFVTGDWEKVQQMLASLPAPMERSEVTKERMERCQRGSQWKRRGRPGKKRGGQYTLT